jgi:hypothetical protein
MVKIAKRFDGDIFEKVFYVGSTKENLFGKISLNQK